MFNFKTQCGDCAAPFVADQDSRGYAVNKYGARFCPGCNATRGKALVAELSAKLAAHGASLFFGDSPASLWVGGMQVGLIRDDDNSDGSELELIDPDGFAIG